MIAIDCSSSDEEKAEQMKKCSDSDSSDSDVDDIPNMDKKPAGRTNRTTRGLSSLLESQDMLNCDDSKGLYASKVSNLWSKVTSGELKINDTHQDDSEEENPFMAKEKRRRRVLKEKSNKKSRPSKKSESSDEENIAVEVEDDSFARDRSPTPPPSPEPPNILTTNRGKKRRMAKGCKKAMDTLINLNKKMKRGAFDDDADDDDVLLIEETPETPEMVREITVKVKSRSGIQRFNMKKCESFNKMMHQMAGHEGIAQERLLFLLNDKIIESYETPNSINLHIADIIDCHIKSARAMEISESDDDDDPDSLIVFIQGKDNKSKRKMKLRKDQPFEKIFREYSKLMGVDYDRLSFRFDGCSVFPQQRPDDHDLEGEECIDALGF